MENLKQSVQELKNMKILIDDTPGLNLLEMQTKVRQILREEKGIKLIVVDYLQLLMENRTFQTRQEEVSNISRQLKNLARELQVSIICLSQLSRVVERREDKRPIMSDLRESGAIEQDADLILLLYRERYYFPSPEEKEDHGVKPTAEVMEIIIAKHRNGPIGNIKVIFEPTVNKFYNASDEESNF
jgi:replicative DNA helicase